MTSGKTGRTSERHGLFSMKRAVRELGDRSLDGRTSVAKALAEWKAELIDDLGGRQAISTQQTDLAVKTKFVVVRDWRFRLEWRLVASAYRYGPLMQVGGSVLEGLRDVLNEALRKHGPMRGFQVIELSNLKRELLERIE